VNGPPAPDPAAAKHLEERQREFDRKRQDGATRVQEYLDAKKQHDAEAGRYESEDWWKAVDQHGRDLEKVNDSLKNLKLSP
jgi:hypothetical protein